MSLKKIYIFILKISLLKFSVIVLMAVAVNLIYLSYLSYFELGNSFFYKVCRQSDCVVLAYLNVFKSLCWIIVFLCFLFTLNKNSSSSGSEKYKAIKMKFILLIVILGLVYSFSLIDYEAMLESIGFPRF